MSIPFKSLVRVVAAHVPPPPPASVIEPDVDDMKAERKAEKVAHKERVISANRAAKNERRRKHADEVAAAIARRAAAAQTLDQAMGEESPETAAQALAFFQRVRNKSGCAYSNVLNALLRGEVSQ